MRSGISKHKKSFTKIQASSKITKMELLPSQRRKLLPQSGMERETRFDTIDKLRLSQPSSTLVTSFTSLQLPERALNLSKATSLSSLPMKQGELMS